MNQRTLSPGSIEVRAVDVQSIAFLALLSVLIAIFADNITSPGEIILKNVLAAVLFLAVLWFTPRIRPTWVRWLVRTASVLFLISFFFNEMGKIVHIFFAGWFDNLLIQWEMASFGVIPTAWFQHFTSPPVTELFMFVYVIYVPMMPYVAWLAFSKAQDAGLEDYLSSLTLTNVICFVGFILFPVASPLRTIPEVHTVPLDGYFFTWITELMRERVHYPGGCLPSPHVAVSTAMLLTIYRHHRPTFWAFLPIVLMIYVSTVYGRFHYVSDGIVGIPVGVLGVWAAPKLNVWWGKVTLVLQLRLHKVPHLELEEV